MRPTLVLALGIALHAALHAASLDDMAVNIPAGATSLLDVGAYRIGYQRQGKDPAPVWLPDSWTGHFTQDVGVAFLPRIHNGKPALLLHCPWKAGTGPAFVDYPLELPNVKPITLAFAIAMRHDVATVDGQVVKSDGVTFSARLTCEGKTRELMREHYTLGEPKPFRFDLSRYAGKRIVLRIQTEPGPKMNASWDFSRFVDPKIIVGSADESLTFAVGEMTKTRAYRVLSKASLLRASNRRGQGITPSCKIEHKNSIQRAGAAFQLIYQGEDCRVVYSYAPTTGSLDDVTVRVDGSKAFRPCAGGGVFFEAGAPETAKPISTNVKGSALHATWRYTKGDESATVTWTFRIVGKALVIAAKSDGLAIARVSLGRLAGVGLRRTIPIPYLYYQNVSYLPEQKAFAMSYMDWTQSHASEAPGSEARYLKKLDGKRNPLDETGYVAVSPDMDEVLPNIPHPASPYRKLLGPKLMLDMWTGEPFDRSAKWLERYKSYGIDEVAIIYHVWQRYGYDVKLPDHIPANPKMGGDEKMKILGATAKRLGYVFSLHENYIDLYPDAPSYTEDAAARRPDGKFWKAWYHKGTKVQSWGLRPAWALKFAAQNSPEIHKRFQTTAAYLDVHTCIQPWRYCDFDPRQPMAGMAACRRDLQARLFQYMRDVHTGPLFGEGSRHFFWAGLVDGVEAQVDGGEDAPALVNFDLLKLHPQMVNHGMGYYTRWLRTRRETKWGVDAPTPAQLDKYRAQELAYGHAAFVGSPLYYNLPHMIREYHLVQPVQALYGNAKVTEVMYEVDGQMVTSSVAAVMGVLDRLRVKYDSGLTLHVNLGATDWKVGSYTLPQFGFLAKKSGLLAYTAKRDGVIVDYARTTKSLFVDSRTEIVLPWTYGQKRVEPAVKEFRYLGGDKFRITYEWRVNDTFKRDLHCFVHFQDMKVHDTAKGIVFQNDHRPPRPTSQWQPGMRLTDGPFTVAVPETCAQKELHILIGLHKGGRVPLSGVSAGARRIAIGRLLITREAGKITNIALAGVDDLRREQAKRQERFTERMNVAGKEVHFVEGATNGSFKLLLTRDGVDLLPFPRDKKFDVTLYLPALAPARFPKVPSMSEELLRTPKLAPRRYRGQVEITIFDAAGKEMGKIPFPVKSGRLAFSVGAPGVARYRIR